MKKIFLFSLFAMMLADCSGQKTPQDYVPQRSDYSLRSDVRVVNDDGEVRWDSIIVYLTDATKGLRRSCIVRLCRSIPFNGTKAVSGKSQKMTGTSTAFPTYRCVQGR